MPDEEEQEITEALVALRRGAPEAMDRLLPVVYGELRRMAHRQLGGERGSHTLSTTAVVLGGAVVTAGSDGGPKDGVID